MAKLSAISQTNPLAGLQINQLVTHQVFKKDGGETLEPKFGKIQKLEFASKRAFEQRLIDILGVKTRSMEMKVEVHGQNTTFQAIASLLRSDVKVFEKRSQVLPKLLTSIQGAGIPAGLLFIFDGKLPDGKMFVGVIKAKSGEGFSMQGDNLTYYEKLFLTKSNDLYKGAIFVEQKKSHRSDDIRSPEDFRVFVYDEGMLRSMTGLPRNYFVKTFLGCCALDSAAEQTALFFNKTVDFIARQKLLDSQRYDLENSLFNYMTSPSPDVNVSIFAKNFEDLSDEYSAFMNVSGVGAISIDKNTSTIEKKLDTRSVKVDRIVLRASREAFEGMEMTETDKEIVLRIPKTRND